MVTLCKKSYCTKDCIVSTQLSILVGNLFCDSGNLLAKSLELKPHYFNIWFLAIGLLGMCCFGIALLCRRNCNNKDTVDKLGGQR